MKLEINIEKRHVYFLSMLIVLTGGILFVQGQGTNNFGHGAEAVDVVINDNLYDLQYAIDNGLLGGGGPNVGWVQSGNDSYYLGGNVGIGKENPTVALDVLGKIKVSSGQKVYKVTNDFCANKKIVTTEKKCTTTSCYVPFYNGYFDCNGLCQYSSSGERCTNTLLGRIVESG